jgi:hypothetical protein
MKRILLAFAITTLLWPALTPQAKADVSVDFFYDNVAGGSWIEVEGYGYCWQPDLAVNDPGWRPYTDGYWAYTDVGWTWISYEDFGWATYHYGRWARLTDYGWVWVPGADLEWGPAWVSWRTGGNYIGWAPLPPRGAEIVYDGRPIGVNVDIEFDIGPEYYNFCDVRYIGEPVLRGRIVDYRQNVTYVNQTVNVTNITVQNNTVYNYGPDVNFVSQRSSRPIQRLHLERQQNADVAAGAKSGFATKVQGNNLVVAAPMRLAKPAQSIAPPTVKTRVAQPKIEKGWAGIDPNTQNQIKQKVKTEDHTKIPPPTTRGAQATGQAGAGASATASPAGANVGAAGKANARVLPSPSATGTPIVTEPPVKGKGRGKPGAATMPTTTPVTTPIVGTSPIAPPAMGRPGKQGGHPGANPPPNEPINGPATGTGENLNTQPVRPHGVKPIFTPPPNSIEGGANEPRTRVNRPAAMTPPPNSIQGGQGPSEARGSGKHPPEGVNVPPSGPAAGQGAATTTSGAEQKHEGKPPKGEKGSPSPSPQ